MNCMKCKSDTMVLNTRPVDDPAAPYVRRLRRCVACRARFATIEVIAPGRGPSLTKLRATLADAAALTLSIEEKAAKRREYDRRRRAKLTPEQRKVKQIRLAAVHEARETGEPIADIMKRWGVA